MNYIYDLVLNFTECSNFLEFYEWNKKDSLTVIQKIPIFKINRYQMEDILNRQIKISEDIFNKVVNKTYVLDGDCLKHTFLVTDLNRVIALDFSDEGVVKRMSSLLLDEEDDVIEECRDYTIDEFNYEVVSSYDRNKFLTRDDKFIRDRLLIELNRIYENKNYDEINYLYEELYSEKMSVRNRYLFLVDDITNNYDSRYKKLYDIVKLTEKSIS